MCTMVDVKVRCRLFALIHCLGVLYLTGSSVQGFRKCFIGLHVLVLDSLCTNSMRRILEDHILELFLLSSLCMHFISEYACGSSGENFLISSRPGNWSGPTFIT